MKFKDWLRSLIGDHHYRQIDPNLDLYKIASHGAESRAMRDLMKDFDDRKTLFHSSYGENIYIQLPEPLEDLDIPGKVNQGRITVTRYSYFSQWGKSHVS